VVLLRDTVPAGGVADCVGVLIIGGVAYCAAGDCNRAARVVVDTDV